MYNFFSLIKLLFCIYHLIEYIFSKEFMLYFVILFSIIKYDDHLIAKLLINSQNPPKPRLVPA